MAKKFETFLNSLFFQYFVFLQLLSQTNCLVYSNFKYIKFSLKQVYLHKTNSPKEKNGPRKFLAKSCKYFTALCICQSPFHAFLNAKKVSKLKILIER